MITRQTVAAAMLALATVLAWAIGATGYITFRDDIASHFNARQAELQYSHNEKLATLRARLDRVSSQRVIEQDGLETRLAELTRRQAQLESRSAILAKLAGRAGIIARSEARDALDGLSLDGSKPLAYAPSPKPVPGPAEFGLREGSSPSPALDAPARPVPLRQSGLPILERIASLEVSTRTVEAAQREALDGLFQRTHRLAAGLRLAATEAGLDLEVINARLKHAGTGGPFVPVPVEATPDGFEAGVGRVEQSMHQLDRMRQAANALPLKRPTGGEAELTSGFGVRVDPFMRTPAMHTGIDFRAEHGAAVRAGGAGRVVGAEAAGGYGNLVEIDHGHGVTTRYAHLSSIAVAAGQEVAAGAIIGRVGSTGRSTGAHLHYETRVDGAPVDPQRFLRAGQILAASLP